MVFTCLVLHRGKNFSGIKIIELRGFGECSLSILLNNSQLLTSVVVINPPSQHNTDSLHLHTWYYQPYYFASIILGGRAGYVERGFPCSSRSYFSDY